jgi:hypothetical protein
MVAPALIPVNALSRKLCGNRGADGARNRTPDGVTSRAVRKIHWPLGFQSGTRMFPRVVDHLKVDFQFSAELL